MTNQNKKENWEKEFEELIDKDRKPLGYNWSMEDCEYGCKHRAIELALPFIRKTRNEAQIELLEKLAFLDEEPTSLLFFGKSYRLGRKEAVKEIKAAAKAHIKKLKKQND